jgi:hypothetical protein
MERTIIGYEVRVIADTGIPAKVDYFHAKTLEEAISIAFRLSCERFPGKVGNLVKVSSNDYQVQGASITALNGYAPAGITALYEGNYPESNPHIARKVIV